MPHDARKFALAGSLAGITEAVVNCPFELVKVRMQMRDSVSPSPTSTPSSSALASSLTSF